jgi:hypothetical protein
MIQRDSKKSLHSYYETYGILETWQPCNLVKDQQTGKTGLLSEASIYLPARLNGEWNFDVTEWVTLSVDGAQTETPIIGIHAFQLRDVRGHFAAILALTRPIERFDLFGELLELGNDELAPESSWYEHNVLVDDSANQTTWFVCKLKVQLLQLHFHIFYIVKEIWKFQGRITVFGQLFLWLTVPK